MVKMIPNERFASGQPYRDKIPCRTCQCRLNGEEGAYKAECQVYPEKPIEIVGYAKECPYYLEGDPIL